LVVHTKDEIWHVFHWFSFVWFSQFWQLPWPFKISHRLALRSIDLM
jgi:hypothetical protein